VRTPDDARDVMQDAYIVAWRSRRDLRDPARWSAWFRKIAVRLAVKHARRVGPRRLKEIPLDGMLDSPGGDPTPSWLVRLTLVDALAQLSLEDRTLLGLRYGADLEVPELAAVLGIRLGTAKSRLHRALKRLVAAAGETSDSEGHRIHA
jgi:RNA polymerase sigma-70 factor (ECF subfamily)